MSKGLLIATHLALNPKVLPQTINQGSQAGYTGYPVEGLRTQMPGTLSIPMSYTHPIPAYKGSNIHQMASHNEGSLIPVSASNSTLLTHYTHPGYTALSPTTDISQGGAQIVTPITPQAYASHGTIGKAPELAQSSLHAPSFHQSAHLLPIQSHVTELIRT